MRKLLISTLMTALFVTNADAERAASEIKGAVNKVKIATRIRDVAKKSAGVFVSEKMLKKEDIKEIKEVMADLSEQLKKISDTESFKSLEKYEKNYFFKFKKEMDSFVELAKSAANATAKNSKIEWTDKNNKEDKLSDTWNKVIIAASKVDAYNWPKDIRGLFENFCDDVNKAIELTEKVSEKYNHEHEKLNRIVEGLEEIEKRALRYIVKQIEQDKSYDAQKKGHDTGRRSSASSESTLYDSQDVDTIK